MKKTILWLVIALCLVLLGFIVFGGAMWAMRWDFTKLSTIDYETNYYEIDNQFSDIRISTTTADITFVPAEDLKYSVVCYEDVKLSHSVTVENGVLSIEMENTRKWYDYIGIQMKTPKITVYLPRGAYGSLVISSGTSDVNIPNDFIFKNVDISLTTGDITYLAPTYEKVKIKASTGDIRVENITTGQLDLQVTTGDISVSNVTCDGDVGIKCSTGKTYISDLACQNFVSEANTGDISFSNAIMSGSLSVERTTGDVIFTGCDAADISVKTSTGDITGSFKTEKIFITETNTGDVVVPQTTSGGKCKIFTTTGDIVIEITSDKP